MFATKNAGKPYAGKPHVRIDEGESGVAIWLPSFSTLLEEIFETQEQVLRAQPDKTKAKI